MALQIGNLFAAAAASSDNLGGRLPPTLAMSFVLVGSTAAVVFRQMRWLPRGWTSLHGGVQPSCTPCLQPAGFTKCGGESSCRAGPEREGVGRGATQQLLPYMVRQQFAGRAPQSEQPGLRPADSGGLEPRPLRPALSGSLPDLETEASPLQVGRMAGASPLQDDPRGWCNGYRAPPDTYCARSNTVSAYLEVNRCVAPCLLPPFCSPFH